MPCAPTRWSAWPPTSPPPPPRPARVSRRRTARRHPVPVRAVSQPAGDSRPLSPGPPTGSSTRPAARGAAAPPRGPDRRVPGSRERAFEEVVSEGDGRPSDGRVGGHDVESVESAASPVQLHADFDGLRAWSRTSSRTVSTLPDPAQVRGRSNGAGRAGARGARPRALGRGGGGAAQHAALSHLPSNSCPGATGVHVAVAGRRRSPWWDRGRRDQRPPPGAPCACPSLCSERVHHPTGPSRGTGGDAHRVGRSGGGVSWPHVTATSSHRAPRSQPTTGVLPLCVEIRTGALHGYSSDVTGSVPGSGPGWRTPRC